jgi:NADPH-dependent 2,4-dienoyl-CoA reductase/sulfur reductase-like enzyme
MRLAVIGGVAAGLSAAARARRLDSELDIVVFEKGDTISYGACGLPYLVEGRVPRPEDLIVYTPEYFRRERNIEIRTRAEIAAILHPRRELALAGGERFRYDRLVIATGGRPVHIGSPAPNVFSRRPWSSQRRQRTAYQAAPPALP